MSEEQPTSGNSNKPKGHGPGKQVTPGANVCPPGAGKGRIGKVIATNPLTYKVRRK